MKKRDGKNSCEQLVCSPGVWLVFKYPLLREACVPWKPLKKLNSEFSLFAALTHDVTQICRDSCEEPEKSKQTRKAASGNLMGFFSLWSHPSWMKQRALQDLPRQILENPSSSHHANPLCHLHPLLCSRKQQSGRRAGVLWFCGDTTAVTLVLFCPQTCTLGQRASTIPSSQKSPGSLKFSSVWPVVPRVLKENQEKADWIQKQSWFIACRFVTRSQQHSNMPQE